MHLVSPLISGVRGAENGTAEIYKRGSSTKATYWLDFEATQSISSGANLVLDSNGGIEVYVNEPVDVVVKNSLGTPVREFVAGYNASAIEVISDSFTGVDYDDGQSGVSKPTTLQMVLDKWNNSAGAADFNILLATGATVTIQSALYSLGGSIFNVKDPAYGAVGDGTTDDTAAINAAIDAADNVNGIVFFPAGTYRVTGAITVNAGLRLAGSGSTSTILSMDGGAANLLEWTSGGAGNQAHVSDMTLSQTGGATGGLVVVSSGYFLQLTNCRLTQTSTGGSPVTINSLTAEVTFIGCRFALAASGNVGIVGTSLTALVVDRCTFTTPATRNSAVISLAANAGMLIRGCVFSLLATTAGTFSCISIGAGAAQSVIAENLFTNTGNAAVVATCIDQTAGISSGYWLHENHNVFGTLGGSTAPRPYGTATVGTEGLTQWYGTRESMKAQVTDVASATLTLRTDLYSQIIVRRTTAAGAQTLDFTFTGVTIGGRFTLLYWNDDGAGATGVITFGTGIRPDTATFTVNANSVTAFEFRFIGIGANSRWVQVAARNPNVAE